MTESARPAAPTRSHYRAFVGRAFTATQGSRTYRLTLDAVRPSPGGDASMRDTCFNLIFTSAASLPDAVYSLRRPGVPAQRLFMSQDGESGVMRALVRRD